MLLKVLRIGLGQVIVAGDLMTRGRPQRRSAEGQAAVAAAASKLALFQFRSCPFCVKTRRTMHRLNVPVTLHDAKNDPVQRERLLAGGGKVKVPCLRIEENGETRWMYESKTIIAYLEDRFAKIA